MQKWNLEPTVEIADSGWRGKWLVLRCANGKTMALVDALVKLGLRAWTPMWLRRKRYPRSNNARNMMLPCLPSFVFLAEADAVRAIDAGERLGVPGFSLMKSYGVLVRIRDSDLLSLKELSQVKPKQDNPLLWPEIGSSQKILSGSFQGLSGQVVGHTKRHCLVQIDNRKFPVVKIPPFLLANVEG